jgi:hypothetical protein
MSQLSPTWVRKNACPTDLSGGRCIDDGEILTHHTPQSGQYNNAPRPEVLEVELSAMRGKLTKTEACMRRNRGDPVAPQDVARAGVHYATAGDLRRAGFAVVHTPGRKGEGNGHVSIVWPDANPLDEQESAWPLGCAGSLRRMLY